MFDAGEVLELVLALLQLLIDLLHREVGARRVLLNAVAVQVVNHQGYLEVALLGVEATFSHEEIFAFPDGLTELVLDGGDLRFENSLLLVFLLLVCHI